MSPRRIRPSLFALDGSPTLTRYLIAAASRARKRALTAVGESGKGPAAFPRVNSLRLGRLVPRLFQKDSDSDGWRQDGAAPTTDKTCPVDRCEPQFSTDAPLRDIIDDVKTRRSTGTVPNKHVNGTVWARPGLRRDRGGRCRSAIVRLVGPPLGAPCPGGNRVGNGSVRGGLPSRSHFWFPGPL